MDLPLFLNWKQFQASPVMLQLLHLHERDVTFLAAKTPRGREESLPIPGEVMSGWRSSTCWAGAGRDFGRSQPCCYLAQGAVPTRREVNRLVLRFLTSVLLIQTSGWDVDSRFVTKVALGGRALTQREVPHLSMLAARINGKTLQMATELLDDTLEAPCPQPMSTEAKYGKLKGRLEHNSGTHLWPYGEEFDEWRCGLEVLCPFFTWNIQWGGGSLSENMTNMMTLCDIRRFQQSYEWT